ncbi:capsid cement protein [Nakamurella lactea]|uniref:capsid cement protein n=1 Tax=Nakamurella lactea TaxID=459515 RepID=UPI0003F988A7|nr:capsid cement protein [Nakamurella lactea]
MANEAIPLFRPGSDVTVQTTAAVTGKTFLGVSGARDTTTGLVKVAPATAAGAVFGVAAYDAASGARVPSISGPGTILFVTAGGTIAAGAQVEVGSGAKAVTLASGIAVGQALEAGAANADVLIKLY